MKKKEALELGMTTAAKGGHRMGEYYQNGRGLMLSKCVSCGAMTIVRKDGKREWSLFGTAQSYKCEKVD